jgi:hypothetical protein
VGSWSMFRIHRSYGSRSGRIRWNLQVSGVNLLHCALRKRCWWLYVTNFGCLVCHQSKGRATCFVITLAWSRTRLVRQYGRTNFESRFLFFYFQTWNWCDDMIAQYCLCFKRRIGSTIWSHRFGTRSWSHLALFVSNVELVRQCGRTNFISCFIALLVSNVNATILLQ